jgi:hypothetical protein
MSSALLFLVKMDALEQENVSLGPVNVTLDLQGKLAWSGVILRVLLVT